MTTDPLPNCPGELRALLMAPVDQRGWRKCTLGGASAVPAPWERAVIEPVQLARSVALRVVTAQGRAQHSRTCSPAAWPGVLEELLAAQPRHIDIMTPEADWHARRGKRRWLVSRGRPSAVLARAPAPHDRPPGHPLDPTNPGVLSLLVAAGLFSPSGQVRGEAAAKYRQVQHYIELLRPLGPWEAARASGEAVRIVDAGCGKAYMSLALLLYAQATGIDAELLGVDREPTVVETASRIAREAGLDGAAFRALSIAELDPAEAGPVDLLVSLHACDSATDDAILAGIRLGAAAIVVAPCCHQELAGQLGAERPADPARAALLRHGIIRQRFAELLTDQLRALALGAKGYRVDMLEFISAEHTHRNLMIRAERTAAAGQAKARQAAREAFEALAQQWEVAPAIRSAFSAEP